MRADEEGTSIGMNKEQADLPCAKGCPCVGNDLCHGLLKATVVSEPGPQLDWGPCSTVQPSTDAAGSRAGIEVYKLVVLSHF